MCRFLVYAGEPVFLETLVSRPSHSLIQQSMHATEAKTPTNGDGFGLGWYAERPEPGVYRDLRPAWSDENLLALCAQVRSPLFFAHVRASTGTATSRANCHPFALNRSLFMHNGQIGGYQKVRRALEAMIPDELYPHRSGTTDSEAIFLAAMALGAERDAAYAFMRVLSAVRGLTAREDIREPLRFAAAYTDGENVIAFRWACDARAPTLYWRKDGRGLHIVSEPIDDRQHGWNPMPQGAALIARPGRDPEVRDFAPECG